MQFSHGANLCSGPRYQCFLLDFNFGTGKQARGFPGRRCDNLSQHAAAFPNADFPPPIELSGHGGHAPVTMRGTLNARAGRGRKFGRAFNARARLISLQPPSDGGRGDRVSVVCEPTKAIVRPIVDHAVLRSSAIIPQPVGHKAGERCLPTVIKRCRLPTRTLKCLPLRRQHMPNPTARHCRLTTFVKPSTSRLVSS
jgi:hypothetical protein